VNTTKNPKTAFTRTAENVKQGITGWNGREDGAMASLWRRKKDGPYYITSTVRTGKRKTVCGCKDRKATEALARKLEGDAMLRREGVMLRGPDLP
jgi:hypothetical protein